MMPVIPRGVSRAIHRSHRRLDYSFRGSRHQRTGTRAIAIGEDSNATGVNGNQDDNSANQSGAAYVFTRSGRTWSQAVSASNEDSAPKGINGKQDDESALEAGAVYIFTRIGTKWVQLAYVRASNTPLRRRVRQFDRIEPRGQGDDRRRAWRRQRRERAQRQSGRQLGARRGRRIPVRQITN
jgi:hypothetical protein